MSFTNFLEKRENTTSSINSMHKLTGSMVALVTPFSDTDQEKLDINLFSELVKRQINGGTIGLVPSGTTGESPTLDESEFEDIVKVSVYHAKEAKNQGKNIKVIVGTGSNCTKKCVTLTARAKELGADGCLIVNPYYNKPSSEGVIKHFEELNKVQIPLMLYNIPGRTGINVDPETTKKIAEKCEFLFSVKAANSDLDEISEVCNIKTSTGKSLAVFSGDDSLTLPILSVGGRGVVSVIGNLIPKVTSTLVLKFHSGDIDGAKEIHHAIHLLCRSLLKLAPNPVPIKSLLQFAGYSVGNCRLPLSPLSEPSLRSLLSVVKSTREDLIKKGIEYDDILDIISERISI